MTYGTLSPRQRTVLQLTADGVPQRMIAGLLTVERSTVSEHLARAREMLGAASTAEAVAIALRRKIIE